MDFHTGYQTGFDDVRGGDDDPLDSGGSCRFDEGKNPSDRSDLPRETKLADGQGRIRPRSRRVLSFPGRPDDTQRDRQVQACPMLWLVRWGEVDGDPSTGEGELG